LGDVVAYARTNPRRLVIAAGGGMASTPYLAAELLKSRTRIDVALVAYKGGGTALDDLLGGHVDVVLDALPVIGPRAQVGRLKPVAVTSAKPSPAMPDLPTFTEAGISDYDMVRWFGISAPANMPPDMAKRLRDEVAKALTAPDVVAELARQGMQPVASEPEDWRAYLKGEVDRYAKILKELGTKPE
jgi:tripartite-type tricarboxylate transporter receptor subunit TctC